LAYVEYPELVLHCEEYQLQLPAARDRNQLIVLLVRQLHLNLKGEIGRAEVQALKIYEFFKPQQFL
jgi:hypothetical protein